MNTRARAMGAIGALSLFAGLAFAETPPTAATSPATPSASSAPPLPAPSASPSASASAAKAAQAPAGSAASVASAAPAAPPSASPSFLQPETGTPVEFDASQPLVSVYVAPGAIDDTMMVFPDPFVKVGHTPLTVKLAPGDYTVHVESPEIPVRASPLHVGTQPVHVHIRAGNDGMHGLGTLLLAVGASSALAGLVIEVSYSEAPNGISKAKIAVPLFAIGGVGVATGLTLYLLTGTTIEQDGLATDRRAMSFGVRSVW
jgi:hypothetical protein